MRDAYVGARADHEELEGLHESLQSAAGLLAQRLDAKLDTAAIRFGKPLNPRSISLLLVDDVNPIEIVSCEVAIHGSLLFVARCLGLITFPHISSYEMRCRPVDAAVIM